MISLIIPVYNEQGAVMRTVRTAHETLASSNEEFEIVIVNDGSTDDTPALLHTIEKEFSNITIVEHKENKGNGAAIKTGIQAAKGEVLCTVDADDTYPIDQFPRLFEVWRMHQPDMIIGRRAKENDGTGFIHRFAGEILNWYGSIITWHHIPDINSGMRLFHRSLVEKFWHLYPDKFSFHITLTIGALLTKHRVLYVNIDYYERIGESKLSSGYKGVLNFAKFMGLITKVGWLYRPIYSSILTAATGCLVLLTSWLV